jgi:uncharacterized membrane protein YeaQ/YmgE (transglycosylase-associated protein family)
MNPILTVLLWIGIGAAAGWLITQVTGTSKTTGTVAVTNMGIGVFGAMATGTIAFVMFHSSTVADAPGKLAFIAGLFAALGGACVLLAVSKLVAKAI